MSNPTFSFGVQSYCFRGFKTHDEVIRCVKACGLDSIELCGVHANFADEKSFAGVVQQYQKAGVRIISIGVQGFRNDAAAETKFFEFVKLAGAKVISADFALETMPDCLKTAEKLAERYDVRLAIHNHGGRHWLGSAQMLSHIFGMTSERIGLCLDTAWAMDAGEDPLAMIEKFGKRLYGLHLKDFVFDTARKPLDVVVGTGNLDLKKIGVALAKVNFNGAAVLEYEGDVTNPVPAVTKCVDAVRAAII
jgi:sugar phosphate isomerase/epimerase